MSPKATRVDSLRKKLATALPTWALPGMVRISADSKIPIEEEKGYTTKCAQRYADAEYKTDADYNGRAHLDTIAQHMLGGGNIGWVPPEGIVVLDCDNTEGVLFVDARRDPAGPVMKRKKDKQHFYMSYNPESFNVYTRAGIALDIGGLEPARIDIKTCGFVGSKKGGGYVVMPPSRHADGVDYKWLKKLPKDRSKIPEIPLDIRNALAPFLKKGASKKISDDNRHLRVLKYQQRLVIEAEMDDDDTRDDIIRRTSEVATELYGEETDRLNETIDSLPRMYDGARGHESAFQGYSEDGSDDYFATIIKHHLDGGLHHLYDARRWHGWDDCFWQRAYDDQIKRVVGDYHRELLTEAAYETDDARQERLLKHAYKLKGVKAVRDIYERLKINLGVSGEIFDQRLELVTFPPCEERGIDAVTMDLDTGETMPPSKDHLITKVMGCPFIPNASHPMVDRFWTESFPDEATRGYMKMILGVSLLGYTPVEMFFFLHGKGGSGKGTLASAMLAALGDYATVADPSTVSGQGSIDGSRNAPDLAALRGKRFVFVDEIAPNRVLGTKLKNLTQAGTITAAAKWEDQMTFPITWTLCIAGNARPRIDTTDKGLMRRIVEIPMDSGALDNDHIDWHVKETLTNDRDAIAAFMWSILEGLTEARAYDFRPPAPPAVLAATAEWIDTADSVGPWLAECCELTGDPQHREMSSSLYTHYEEWMDETYGRQSRRDVPRATPNQFAEALKSRGATKRRLKRGQYWLGLRLLQAADALVEGGTPSADEPKLPN